MAVELAAAYVSLTVSAKGIKQSIEKEMDVDAVAKTAGKDAGSGFGKAFTAEQSAAMKTVGAGMLAFGAIATVALGGAIKAASNLGESVNAVNVTFGDAAGGVLKLGEDAATSLGLSASAFNGLAVQFSAFASTIAGPGGDVVQTLDDLTTRGADFASVMNLDVAEAMTLFQSGLAGETEPLRKFGIDLSAAAVESFAYAHGIGTVGTALTESEKVQARYGSLMEQTNKTAGDFANTSGGLANQQRIMKAEMENAAAAIGTGLLPVMATMVGFVAKGVSAFSDLNEATGGMAGVLLAVTAGVSLLGGAALIAIPKLIAMKATLTGLGVSGTGAMAALGPLIAAVAAGASVFAAFNAITAKNTEDLDGLSGAYQDLGDSSYALGAGLGQLVGLNDGTAESFRNAERAAGKNYAAMTDGIVTLQQLNARLDENNVGVQQGEIIVGMWADAQKAAADATANQADALLLEADAAAEATSAALEHADWLDVGSVASATMSDTTSTLASDMAGFAETATAAREANEKLIESMLAAVPSAFDYEQSVLALDTAYSDYEEQLWTTMATLNDSTVADSVKEQALRDLRSAEIDNAEAALTTSEAYAAESGAVAGSQQAIDLQIASLQASQEKYPELREEIQVFIDKLNAIPPDTVAGVGVDVDYNSFNAALLQLEAISKPIFIPVTVGTINQHPIKTNMAGSFVPGGSNILTTAGELSGSRGDEAILPLGDPARLRQLLGNSRIGPRVLDALGAGIGSGGGGGAAWPDTVTLIVEGEPITARIQAHARDSDRERRGAA